MTPTLALTPNSKASDVLAEAHLALPPRFDVHEVDRVVSKLVELAHGGRTVIVDGSSVEMIDHSALSGLSSMAAAIDMRIEQASVALLATVRYTGCDLLADRCATATLLEAA